MVSCQSALELGNLSALSLQLAASTVNVFDMFCMLADYDALQ